MKHIKHTNHSFYAPNKRIQRKAALIAAFFCLKMLATFLSIGYNVENMIGGAELIQLIFGEKGSGKTKKILDLANLAANDAKGSIAFIDIDDDYMYDLNLSVRFINATEYSIVGPKMFFGFLCGISASDHDLEYVFVDGFMQIIKHDLFSLEDLFAKLDAFSDAHGIKLILSLSCSPEQLPPFLKPYCR